MRLLRFAASIRTCAGAGRSPFVVLKYELSLNSISSASGKYVGETLGNSGSLVGILSSLFSKRVIAEWIRRNEHPTCKVSGKTYLT